MADVVDLIKRQHRQLDELLEQAQQAAPDRVAALLQQVADLLIPHSKAEESFVYPAIQEYDREEAEDAHDAVAEHQHVEGLLKQLLAEDPSAPGYDGKLAAMIGEIRHHVDEEEQDLLPVLTDRASDDERAELGARFAEETGFEIEADAGPTKRATEEPEGASKEELYQQAREQQIPGRSTMSKDELAKALRERGSSD